MVLVAPGYSLRRSVGHTAIGHSLPRQSLRKVKVTRWWFASWIGWQDQRAIS
jgi:hypothetical protein